MLSDEHLQNGDGIDGYEIVQEQIGVHPTDVVASAGGADIDDDGQQEHSNVHIGELQWGTDSNNPSDTPDPTVPIEADYHSRSNNSLLDCREAWERDIERTYALYGVNVTFVNGATDVLDRRDVEQWCVMSRGTESDQYLPPTNETYFAFSIEEVITVSTEDSAVNYPTLLPRGKAARSLRAG